MFYYRGMDENDDYKIGNQNAFLSGVDAVGQAIKTRLRLLLYEWWEQIEDGVPYWQQIIAQRDTFEAVQIIRRRIEQTPHVIAVLAIEHNWNNETRTLTIHAAVETEYGNYELNYNFGEGE